MSPEAERQLLLDVASIKEALVGNLNGKKGALQNIEMIIEELYNPNEPETSLRYRIRILEESSRERSAKEKGAIAVISGLSSAFVILVGWLIGLFKH